MILLRVALQLCGRSDILFAFVISNARSAYHCRRQYHARSAYNSPRANITEKKQIAFTHQHVYHWHENENSITRINNAQYTYGSSTRDSFYGLVENSIYAIKEAKKRDLNEAQREFVTKLTIESLINLYVYYLAFSTKSSLSVFLDTLLLINHHPLPSLHSSIHPISNPYLLFCTDLDSINKLLFRAF